MKNKHDPKHIIRGYVFCLATQVEYGTKRYSCNFPRMQRDTVRPTASVDRGNDITGVHFFVRPRRYNFYHASLRRKATVRVE